MTPLKINLEHVPSIYRNRNPGEHQSPPKKVSSGNLLFYCIIAVVGFLLYFKTVFFGFTFLDDTDLITDNTGFISKLSNIIAVFQQEVLRQPHQPATQYRPLLMASFILNAQVAGTAPWAYHLINVLLHCCASCLVFLLFVRLHYHRMPAFFFSLLFTVHPALAQAVAWIPGRADSLMTIFTLASIISFIGAATRRSMLLYCWHLLWLTCALLTKETSFPVIVICVLYFYAIRRERFVLFREGIAMAGWAITLAAWLFLRHAAIQNPASISLTDMLLSVLTKLPAVIHYVGKAFFPFNLSVFPVMRDTTFLYGAIAVAVLILLAVRTGRDRLSMELFGALWLILFLVPPFIQPDPLSIANFFEHRFYLPIIGIFIILLETDALNRLFLKPRLLFAGSCVLILTYAILTFVHSEDFRDRMSFWNNAVKTSPHSSHVHLNRGYLYYADGLLDKAGNEYKTALRLNPAEMRAHNNLGLVYMFQGRYGDAEAEFLREVINNPLYDKVYFNLGFLYYYHFDKKDDALFLWKKTIEINPDYCEAHKKLSEHYYRANDYVTAHYYTEEYRKRCPP